MASLIDTLIDVLGQEDAEYKKLLELSNNKTKAIVGADIERLQDILVQEQARIDAINKLEQQRMENVDDICNVLNLRRTDIKLEDILEVLNAPLMTASLPISVDQDLNELIDPELVNEKYESVVDLVIDGGVGQEGASTVVDCLGEDYQIIRQGKGVLI